ncbi:GAD-like domain-containing protein, partial [Marinospirillum sp.]|uniref:GAD-like domain-containing protein n=1 Tax=Marinospirillum sp. TaxID=2183934 RepID=UPI003A89FF06
MNRFEEDFLDYAGFGPAMQSKVVPADKIARFRGKLPDKLLEYWQTYGWCGYAKGLFWTVDPDEWEPALEAWIGDTPFMEQDEYYVIARSAFGELYLWGRESGDSLT